MPRLLTPSTNLETPPPIVVDGDTVLLTPASYASWTAMFAANTTKKRYYLQPGDYRPWGQCAITLSGAPGARKEMRYYHPATHDLHPYDRRDVATEARVDVIKYSGGSSRPHDWYFHGLTGRQVNGEWSTGSGTGGGKATYVTWDYCLEEEALGYGVRIHASHCTVQRCVIRQATDGGQNDAPGLQIYSGSTAEAIEDVKFLDNELIDWADGIALSDDASNSWTPYNNILVEGNDVYVTSARYLAGGLAETENGLDCKAGSDLPNGIILRKNRWWGFRQTVAEVGSIGQALAIHRYARNVLIEDDIVGDSPVGITEFNWVDGVPQTTPRNTVLRRVWFHDIRDYAAAGGLVGAAACTRANGETRYEDCRFVRSGYVAYKHGWTPAAGPTFTGCVRIGTETFHPDSVNYPDDDPYDAALNSNPGTPARYDTYERKRWTGREFAVGAVPAVVRGMIVHTGGYGARQGGGSGITVHTP